MTAIDGKNATVGDVMVVLRHILTTGKRYTTEELVVTISQITLCGDTHIWSAIGSWRFRFAPSCSRATVQSILKAVTSASIDADALSLLNVESDVLPMFWLSTTSYRYKTFQDIRYCILLCS
jgi:hypothetical protein